MQPCFDTQAWEPVVRVASIVMSSSSEGAIILQAPTLTQETCVSFNLVKIHQAALRWTGNVAYADAAERVIFNGLLGTQRLPYKYGHQHQTCAPVHSPCDCQARTSFLSPITL